MFEWLNKIFHRKQSPYSELITGNDIHERRCKE